MDETWPWKLCKNHAGRNLHRVTSLSEPAVEIKKVEKKVAVEIKKAILAI